MMQHVFHWLASNQLVVTAVVGVVCLAIPNTILVKAGFWLSQMVRHALGVKAEQKLEDIVDGFDKGLKSDNPGTGIGPKK